MSVYCLSGKAMKWTHLNIHLGPFWGGGCYLMDHLPNLPVGIASQQGIKGVPVDFDPFLRA